MTDSKSTTNNRDRTKVAGEQKYEIHHLAKEAGITADQARQLIQAYGNDREKLMRAAKSLATRSPQVRSSRV